MATTKASKQEQAQQPEPHVPRTSLPSPPGDTAKLSSAAQSAIHTIRMSQAYPTNLARMQVESVRTLNLHPAVAIYKTEMLEYLNTLKG